MKKVERLNTSLMGGIGRRGSAAEYIFGKKTRQRYKVAEGRWILQAGM